MFQSATTGPSAYNCFVYPSNWQIFLVIGCNHITSYYIILHIRNMSVLVVHSAMFLGILCIHGYHWISEAYPFQTTTPHAPRSPDIVSTFRWKPQWINGLQTLSFSLLKSMKMAIEVGFRNIFQTDPVISQTHEQLSTWRIFPLSA
jgi:hypothetical protein